MDRNEKVWAYSNTGMRMHAFVQTIEGGGFKRAVCRSSILRNMDAIFVNWGEAHSVCPRCAKLMEAMYARAEASMQPATEADDLGYVAPVEENVRIDDV
ncbi:MAG TPA: hypothetical protein VLG91_10885, partial [Streptomyces sp.]|nr:hypothetical protein [Streptomyces sp.]